MIKEVVLFVIGLILLMKAGDWFVDGATGIAHRFHVPELLIGATVVSIGTTIPEVMVSATSAISGVGDIAYGNALGSIICNTSLIAAITLAVRPGVADRKSIKTSVGFFFLAMIIYAVNAYVTGYVSRWLGIILLAIFCVYIGVSIKQVKGLPDPEPEEEIEVNPLWKDLMLIIVGAALIALGANLLVDNGQLIAEAMGVPTSVIAVTFIALGTSLPELTTAITALAKGHSDLSLGNVIGANLFNIVLVNGVSATLAPFSIPVEKTIAGMNASLVIDIPLALGVMLIMTLPALIKEKLYRWQGIALLCIYAMYLVFQFAF